MSERRAMIVVTHLLGVGHLARMAAVARALASEGWRVAIASGGRPVPTARLAGCELVQLPPVHCVGADFATLYSGEGIVADAAYLDGRRVALLEAFDAFRPQALIVELYPFGRRVLSGEFEALLERAAAADPRPAVLCSVRDVLNPPSRPERAVQALERLARHFDRVLFHGDSAVVPLAASWPVTPPLARRVLETGYVHDSGAAGPGAGASDGSGEILVSGGGSAASLPLARAAVDAARLLPERTWRLLVGHGVPAEDFAGLRAGAPANLLVERARPDFAALLARAALSISQAGYNTVLDLAAAQARAILVPFSAGSEREQTIRAEELARRGLARVLETEGLGAAALAREAADLLAAPRPDWSAITRNGAARAAGLVAGAVARSEATTAAWRGLDAALDEARASGRTIEIWLRDDDAVEPTPALDRFLALLERWSVPVALAVIPARASEALAARLAETASVDVLVHGWAHANHAPAGMKSREFGPDRPMAALRGEAARGLARLRALIGARALPVFVPPWNRVDPAFVGLLPGIGYRGLSTYLRSSFGDTPAGLVRANTNWDPIAWKAGGGLREEAGLLDQLAALIREELAAPAGTLEPIGLLTHHLVHDGWIERFLGEVLGRLAASGAVRFVRARDVFPAG